MVIAWSVDRLGSGWFRLAAGSSPPVAPLLTPFPRGWRGRFPSEG
jgi:hypothetical protein